jgi:Mce-associated membrane protein
MKLRIVAWAAVIVTAGFAGWACWSYVAAARDGDRAFGQARDEVVAVGRARVATLNTMDYQHAEDGFARWLDASTGPLHGELERGRDANLKQIKQARASAVATVTGAAVTELDRRAGTAELLASVEIRLTPAGAAETVQRNRYRVSMSRTDEGWKVSTLSAIVVSAG